MIPFVVYWVVDGQPTERFTMAINGLIETGTLVNLSGAENK